MKRAQGQSQIIKNKFGLPFEFTRLTRSPGNVLQLEHSSEGIDDDLGHQGGTKSPSQDITAEVMLLGTRTIDLRRLRKRTLLKRHEDSPKMESNAQKLTFLFAVVMSR
jgi:hypothetical protein